MKRVRFKRVSAIAVTLGLLIASFQNCTRTDTGFKSKTTEYSSASGNGDGYSGKPGGDLYRRYDDQTPCVDLDRYGKPLPNEQIFYQSKSPTGPKEPYVVRQNCSDVTPQPIASTDLKYDGSGSLIFKGQSFAGFQATADFQVLAAACPAGKSPIANAARTNLIVNSQDWTEQPVYQGWMWHAGIVAILNGSIKSLPAYNLVRTDPAFPEEFRRISQIKKLNASTDYSFSFLAKKGTRDLINFRYYRVDGATGNEEYIIIDFNLVTGTSSIRLNSNLAPAKVTMTPVGEGYFCTVYFTTSPTAAENYSDVGFSPTAVNGVTHVGDSVYATAAQLEATGGFCQ
jgi:hypothetical protein